MMKQPRFHHHCERFIIIVTYYYCFYWLKECPTQDPLIWRMAKSLKMIGIHLITAKEDMRCVFNRKVHCLQFFVNRKPDLQRGIGVTTDPSNDNRDLSHQTIIAGQ